METPMSSENTESKPDSFDDDQLEEAGGLTEEQALRKRAGRTIGRGVWLVGFEASHPNATKEEKKAAWAEDRRDFKVIGMKALRTLEKAGMKVVENPDSVN